MTEAELGFRNAFFDLSVEKSGKKETKICWINFNERDDKAKGKSRFIIQEFFRDSLGAAIESDDPEKYLRDNTSAIVIDEDNPGFDFFVRYSSDWKLKSNGPVTRETLKSLRAELSEEPETR